MSTTEEQNPAAEPEDLTRFEANIERLEALSQRLVSVMSHRRQVPAALQGPSHELFLRAASAYWSEMVHNPARVFEHQVSYWSKTMRHYLEAQQAMTQNAMASQEAPANSAPSDRRFSDPMWQANPYFNFVKQQYLLNAEAVQTAVSEMEDLPAPERARVGYFAQQIIDMMAPTNFLATNPEALTRALETQGQSLIDGLEHLIADLEANDGELVVNLADKAAFTVGQNLATTPGKVVFRNRMLELIQYTPTTDQVHSTPIVLFPPWINKFYILDLKAQNSLIKWIVDQGYTLFVVSWKNPDLSYAEVAMDDYMQDGYLAVFDEVKKICDVPQVNAVGYCIAGTTLSLVLALLAKRGDTSVKSATFFTTLTDFSDQGEFSPFLTDDFVDGIEAEATRKGVLESFYMARTFSFLRANDLVYGPAIRSYMLGQMPPAFDLLYWNGDGANLPARMAVQYLRQLCQDNAFCGEGVTFCGEELHISDVQVPLCSIACETDHIAAWSSCYRGVQQMGSADKTFVLSGSGHIAGIVNPPAKRKYGYRTNPDLQAAPQDWQAAAQAHEGSWWPMWEAWIAERSGDMCPARHPGDGGGNVLCAAPGTYVVEVPDISED